MLTTISSGGGGGVLLEVRHVGVAGIIADPADPRCRVLQLVVGLVLQVGGVTAMATRVVKVVFPHTTVVVGVARRCTFTSGGLVVGQAVSAAVVRRLGRRAAVVLAAAAAEAGAKPETHECSCLPVLGGHCYTGC